MNAIRLCSGLAVVVGTLALCEPALATGGTMHVELCRLSDGSPSPSPATKSWTGLLYESCATGGSFGMSFGARQSGYTSFTATLTPPAGLSIVKADVWSTYSLPVSSDNAQPDAQTSWENRGTGESGNNAYDPTAPATGRVSIANPISLSMTLRCNSFGSCSNGGQWGANKMDLTVSDGNDPSISDAPADLFGAPRASGWITDATRTLRLTAGDAGAGVYRALLREGTTVHRYPLLSSPSTGCRDVDPAGTAYDFAVMQPCPTTTADYGVDVPLDRDLGDGAHDLALGLEDAAGNAVWRPAQTVRINAPGGTLPDPGVACSNGGQSGTYDDSGTCSAGSGTSSGGGGGGVPVGGGTGSPASATPAGPVPTSGSGSPAAPRTPNGSGASAGAELQVHADGGGRTVSSAYGRRVVIVGHLLSSHGTPIGGARIEVQHYDRVTGASVAREPSVTTDENGVFRYQALPGGSRIVRFGYRAFAEDSDLATTGDVDLRVLSAVRLDVDSAHVRNHHAVTFRGSVAGAPARSRKVVEMQVRQRGRWLTFGTTRLAGGRFVYRYRFTRTSRPTTFVFRAIVRSEAGWPYETAPSNGKSVRVRP